MVNNDTMFSVGFNYGSMEYQAVDHGYSYHKSLPFTASTSSAKPMALRDENAHLERDFLRHPVSI